MQGLRGIIRDYLPEPWEVVLRRHGLINAFIEYVYRSQPSTYKGKYGYLRGKRNVIIGYKRTKIYEMFQVKDSKEGLRFWMEIDREITEYKESCR